MATPPLASEPMPHPLTSQPRLGAASDPAAEPVAATEFVYELVIPAGANGSKVGTFVQQSARDDGVPAGVPEDLKPVVEEGAALIGDRRVCLAIRMEGPVGEKMKSKLGASDGDAYMLFGLV